MRSTDTMPLVSTLLDALDHLISPVVGVVACFITWNVCTAGACCGAPGARLNEQLLHSGKAGDIRCALSRNAAWQTQVGHNHDGVIADKARTFMLASGQLKSHHGAPVTPAKLGEPGSGAATSRLVASDDGCADFRSC